MRYQRSVMLDVLGADYIRTARSKGLQRGTALVRHIARSRARSHHEPDMPAVYSPVNLITCEPTALLNAVAPIMSSTPNLALDRAIHLLLPTIALALMGAASYSRYQRSVMLDVLGADYIRTARSKMPRQLNTISSMAEPAISVPKL
jgi:ABC-type dipeptide/oligopeptide/nickel transport system permease component